MFRYGSIGAHGPYQKGTDPMESLCRDAKANQSSRPVEMIIVNVVRFAES